MDAMTVSNGVNPGSKRADGEHQRSEIQRQASEKVSKLSTYLDRLPFEIQAMVAKNLIQREDLKNLSEVSSNWKDVALLEINLQNEMATVKELQVLSDLLPSKPVSVSSALDLYKAFLADMRYFDLWFTARGVRIDDDKLQELQQALTALSTTQVAEQSKALKLECYKQIMSGDASIERIDEKYSTLKSALVSEAFKHIISSSINAESTRGEIVAKAALYGHLSIVQALLADGAQISEEDRGVAIDNAAENGYLSLVEALLADGALILEYQRSRAFELAAQNGHLEVVKCLVANWGISEGSRGQAVRLASRHGHHSVADFLKQNQGWSCSVM